MVVTVLNVEVVPELNNWNFHCILKHCVSTKKNSWLKRILKKKRAALTNNTRDKLVKYKSLCVILRSFVCLLASSPERLPMQLLLLLLLLRVQCEQLIFAFSGLFSFISVTCNILNRSASCRAQRHSVYNFMKSFCWKYHRVYLHFNIIRLQYVPSEVVFF